MKRFFSLRRATLALSLFGVLGLVPLPAAQAEPFQASGSYVETSYKGNRAKGTLAGEATPGGAFSGDFGEKVIDEGNLLDGRATLDFGDGDTFTFDYVLVYDEAIGLYLGSYVIHGGTGTLKRATGGGALAVTPNVEGAEHLFWLDGELFLDR